METAIQHQLGVIDAIRQRRAVRNYMEENPGDSCIRGLLEAAVRAPTAMHLEPWAFVVIQDRALLKRYSDRAKTMVLDEHRQGKDARLSSYLGMLRDPAYNIFYDAGTLIVICRKSNAPFADADCWLAAENLMLAAVDGGLGTCCIGFALPVLNAPDVRRDLGVPEEGAAVAPILLGRVRGTVAAVSRRPPEILRWVR